MDCLLCKFAAGDSSFHKFYENEEFLAGVFTLKDEIPIIILPKIHFNSTRHMGRHEHKRFIEFGRQVGEMITRAYGNVGRLSTIMSSLPIDHFHEENTLRPGTRLKYPAQQQTLQDEGPYTAAGIAQKIRNWAPKEFQHPHHSLVKYTLPEWIKEILSDGSLLAGNSSPVVTRLVDQLLLNKTNVLSQQEVDDLIDTHC